MYTLSIVTVIGYQFYKDTYMRTVLTQYCFKEDIFISGLQVSVVRITWNRWMRAWSTRFMPAVTAAFLKIILRYFHHYSCLLLILKFLIIILKSGDRWIMNRWRSSTSCDRNERGCGVIEFSLTIEMSCFSAERWVVVCWSLCFFKNGNTDLPFLVRYWVFGMLNVEF